VKASASSAAQGRPTSVATYFLRSMHISRGKGSLATRAAAYRAGEKIKDERTGETFDYSDRRDIAHKEVVLPLELEGREDMAWTQDRAILWNAMEHAGTRHNSRTAREWLMLVPSELTPEQRIGLVRTFAAELANRYRCAVDLAIHQPREGADRRNHHAHLLMTVREVSPEGPGARTTLELGGYERHDRGLGPARGDYLALRKLWADVTNEALREAGLEARVDHRSYEQQGLQREPRAPLPDKVFYAERKYGPSEAGNAIRARHQERVEAKQVGADELARVVERQRKELRERALEDFKRRDSQPMKTRWIALTKEERNALRREKYEARRVIERQDPVAEARRRQLARERGREWLAKNPERARQLRREWRSEHRDEVNRKQREYRKAHASELNAKRREHSHANADEANRKQREYRREVRLEREASESHTSTATSQSRAAPAAPTQDGIRSSTENWREYRQTHGPGPTAEETVRNWQEYRRTHGSGPTPEESARNWLEYQKTHGRGPTAEESAQNWLAHRQSQEQAKASQTSPSPAREQQQEPERSDDRSDEHRPSPDQGLEL
jgi:hypothetical protein